MRQTYRVLASIIALLVVVQAMTMVFAVAGFFHWIDDGNTADKSVFESWEDNPPDFVGSLGFLIHGVSGMNAIPALALLLLIVSFFAKVPRGVLHAVVVVLSTALQVFMGIAAHSNPALGLIHGVNAFILFGAAAAAAQAAKQAAVANAGTPTAAM
jgi:hypothetical protein